MMDSANIETLLKVATPVAKAPQANAPRENGDSFGNYLRDAAGVKTEKPAITTSPTNEKPAEEQPIATTGGQEQGSTATPDQETVPTEQLVATNEEEISEAITDEIILSVAAGAMVETEVAVDVPVVFEPIETGIEAVDPTAAKDEAPTPNQSTGELLPIPLDIVDTTENTATYSEGQNENVEKVIPIESELSTSKSVEVAKNSALTSVVEAPKATVAPKPTKVIVPDKSTESESQEETPDAAKTEPINIEAVVVEAVAKVVEATPVTIEAPTIETKADAPAPTTQAPVNVSQNQSPPIQPQPTHAEAPTPHAESDSHMPTIDRARFVQRVANAFRSAQQNDGQIQMRLSPPELGSLKIEIAVRNGVLSANLEAETPDARRVLLDNLPALRQRLAEQDIRIDKFEVDIRQEGGQQQGQAEAQQQQTEQQSQRAAARNRIRTSPVNEVITARVSRGVTKDTNSGLDVRV